MSDRLDYVGARLRERRRARGWTLDDLAARAGVSKSTLSRLESGKRQASLELLLPLTQHLGIRIDDLVRAEAPDPRVRRPPIRREGKTIIPLSPEGSSIHTFRITYHPTSTVPEPRIHGGHEWLYVLSGKLRLQLGEQVLILGRGEAAEFDTGIPHSHSAAGSRPATIISIFNETGARIHTHTAV